MKHLDDLVVKYNTDISHVILYCYIANTYITVDTLKKRLKQVPKDDWANTLAYDALYSGKRVSNSETSGSNHTIIVSERFYLTGIDRFKEALNDSI